MSELVKRKSEISEAPVKDAGVNVGDMFIYNNSSSRGVVRILFKRTIEIFGCGLEK